MELKYRNMLLVLAFSLFSTSTPAECQPIDAIKNIGNFPFLTAVYSSTATAGGDSLLCLSAVLTQYNPEASNVTYVWLLREDDGTERPVIHRIYEGDAPNQVKDFSSDDPSSPATATITYTDSETCFVMKTNELGGLCILWVNSEFKNNFPQECTLKYEESCGEGVLIYDQDVCDKSTST
ncbi:uncharacterized protein LOC144134764 [Amblyomma americanum]